MNNSILSWGDYHNLPLIGPPLTADAQVLVDRVLHVAIKAKAFTCKQKGRDSTMCSLVKLFFFYTVAIKIFLVYPHLDISVIKTSYFPLAGH